MKLFTKQRVTDIENKTYSYQGDREGGINWKIGVDIHILL